MRLIPEKDFPELQRHPKSGIWYVVKHHNGKTICHSTREKNSKPRAKQIALRKLAEFLGKPIRGYMPTFDDVAREVIKLKSAKAPATLASAENTINKHLLPFFTGYRIDEVTEGLWEEYVVSKQMERQGTKLFNHWKQFISIMGRAHRRGLIQRPIKVKNPDPETKAGKVFSDEEIDRLLAAASEPVRLQILMAVTMGMRKSELLGLTWDRVDLVRKVIRLRAEDTKIRKAREFAISESVYKLLAAVENRSGPVFPSRYMHSIASTSNKTAWINCKRRAKVSGRFHDLRHTFLTRVLLQYKASPLDVAVFAGVSLEEIQKTYLHPSVEDTRSVASLITVNYGSEKAST